LKGDVLNTTIDAALLARARAQSRLSQRALVVLLTTLDPSAVDGGLLDTVAAISAKHAVVVASVDDPELAALEHGRDDAHDYYAAAAAARTALESDAIAARVRELGAEVVTALPDDLAPALPSSRPA